MIEKIKKLAGYALAIAFIILISIAIRAFWLWFISLDSSLAVGMITAFTAVLTLVCGRYFERVKEAEAHLRATKIEMYDNFLKEFFELLHSSDSATPSDENEKNELVAFLQEWQRKLVVWGGHNVMSSYIKWKEHLSSSPANANTIFLMDAFFKAMRKDIGLSNQGLEKGFFAHLILRHASLFLAEAKKNPKITLNEMIQIEKSLGLN